jgi:hypothetical protein
MLIFGIIVESTYYEGIPYLWVFGSPVLVLIVMLRKEYRYKYLMVDSNKFNSLNQSVQQLQYLTNFLNFYQSDRNTIHQVLHLDGDPGGVLHRALLRGA